MKKILILIGIILYCNKMPDVNCTAIKHYVPLWRKFKPVNFNRSGYWPDFCEDLNPVHLNLTTDGISYQKGPWPYTFGESFVFVEADDKLTFQIKSNSSSDTFQNYIIQCKQHALIAGSFEKKPDNIVIDCFGFNASTVMHANNDDKTEVSITWITPNYLLGEMQFIVTIIKNKDTWWHARKAFTASVTYNCSLHPEDYDDATEAWYAKRLKLEKEYDAALEE